MTTTEPGADSGFKLRSIAFTAYGPTTVSSIGFGAMMPVLALHARELGASVSTAAFVVALLGVGSLVASLPASSIVARIGERRALMFAGGVDAVAMTCAVLAPSVLALGVAVVVSGAAWTTFLMARQGYMIDAVPPSHRARALSTLGGTFRIGLVIGPALGAGLIQLTGDLRSGFVIAAVASLCSATMAGAMPDLSSHDRAEQRQTGHLSVRTVLRQHAGVFATLGVVVVVISASRSVRAGLLPLWADHVGLSASATSLLFALAGLVDVALFYPGGWVMDRFGRTATAIPVVLAVAVGTLLLPLTSGFAGVAAVMGLIALGNGLGSGIVMTLGADAAPLIGRAQFLGGWRLCGDIGGTGAPLLVSGLAALISLPAVCLALGASGLLGTAWVGYWTRLADRERLASASGVSRSVR